MNFEPHIIRSQAELDKFPADKSDSLLIAFGNESTPAILSRALMASVEVHGDYFIELRGEAKADIYDKVTCFAFDHSEVYATNNTTVFACGDAFVLADEKTNVRAYGRAFVDICDDVTVSAYNNCHIDIPCCGHAKVYDNVLVRAFAADIEAHGNCTILDFTGHSRVVSCDDTVNYENVPEEEADRMGDFLEGWE